MPKPTHRITIGDREFQIPGRLPFGIIRQHPKAFVALAKVKEYSLEAVLSGDAVDAMEEIVHAAIASIDPTVTPDALRELLNGLDFQDGFKALADAIGTLMQSKRGAPGTVAGESASSQSATSAVSAG